MEPIFRPPEPLSLDGNVADNWRRWNQRFELFMTASDSETKDNKVKVAILLSSIGPDALELYNTFDWAEGENKNDYKHIIKKLEDHCKGLDQEIIYRADFWSYDRPSDQAFDIYYTTLKMMAQQCNFMEKDNMIRDKIVFSMKDLSMKEKLLNVAKRGELSLKKCVDLCKTAETTKKDMESMKASNESSEQAVSVDSFRAQYSRYSPRRSPGRGTGSQRGGQGRGTGYKQPNAGALPWTDKKCFRCDRRHGTGQCNAIGQICGSCGKPNHFSRCCRSTNWASQSGSRPTGVSMVQVSDNRSESDTEADDTFELDTLSIDEVNSEQKVEIWKESLTVNDKQCTFKLDTGAAVNTMPLSLFKKCTEGTAKPLKPTKAKLIGYFGQKKQPVGKATLLVTHKDKYFPVTFIVLQQNVTPVIGGSTCIELGLIKRVHTLKCDEPQAIIEEYPEVFQGLGCIDMSYDIKIDPTVKPVIHAPRRIPHALMAKTKAKLGQMVEQGLIQPVEKPTQWVNSMVVVDRGSKIRIVLDPRDLNEAIQREHYPMKTIEQITPKLANASIFSRLDASQAYFQIPVSEESSDLLTFNSPFGRYQYRRMAMGIKSAPEVWQRTADQIFGDIEGCEVLMDDLLIYAGTLEQHNERLRAVLQRAKERNITFNKEKSKLGLSEIQYMGHILTPHGSKVSADRIKAITDMPCPQSKEDLQRFLGMVTYVGKYIPNLSKKTAPLRELLQQNIAWHWDPPRHGRCLEELKRALTQAPVLRYYNVNEPVTISVDASSEGLGAAILQNNQPVAYASRCLTSAEKNYAQIEREMLGIQFGCAIFHDYIYGRADVLVESDHRPLENLARKNLNDVPQRIQRMRLKIQKYNVTIKYRPGKELFIADTLSRAAIPSKEATPEIQISVIEQIPITNARLQQVRKETNRDETLQTLKEYVIRGWPEDKALIPEALLPYWNTREDITVADQLLLKGDRIIVPHNLRKEILQKLHKAHLGIDKCKMRAKDTVYWPGLNSQLTDMISQCSVCLEHKKAQPKEPMLLSEQPSRPWQKLGSDLFELEGKQYILLVDYHSKFTEFTQLKSTTSEAVITWFKHQFARYGIPDMCITDGGPQYSSRAFKDFADTYGFTHIMSSPYYSQGNALAERQIQTLKAMLKKCKQAGEDINLAMLEWRNTPIEGLGSPAQLLMGRRLQTVLPSTHKQLKPQIIKNAQIKLHSNQVKQKVLYDQHAKKLPELKPGDTVRLKREGTWKPAVVKAKADTPRSYFVQHEGVTYRRNRRHLMLTNERNTKTGQKTPSKPQNVTKSEPRTSSQGPATLNIGLFPQKATTVNGPACVQRPAVRRTPVPRMDIEVQPRRSGRVIQVPSRFRE